MDCLRQVPASDLYDAFLKIRPSIPIMPCQDQSSEFIPYQTMDIIHSKKFADIPTIIHNVKDEGTFIIPTYMKSFLNYTEKELLNWENSVLGFGKYDYVNKFLIRKVYDPYDKNEFKEPWLQLAKISGDILFRCTAFDMGFSIKESFKSVYTHINSNPQWTVDFLGPNMPEELGAYHASEVPFYFRDVKYVDDWKVSDTLVDAFVDFAANSKPHLNWDIFQSKRQLFNYVDRAMENDYNFKDRMRCDFLKALIVEHGISAFIKEFLEPLLHINQ